MTERANNPTDGAGSTGFDRRTVIKAAAWSAPVVAIAVAAPMAAASVAADDFAANVSTGSTSAGTGEVSGYAPVNLYGNLWLNTSVSVLSNGLPGDTTGEVTMAVTVPTGGYALHESNGGSPTPTAGAALSGISGTYQGWTWSRPSSSSRFFTFKNPGIVIAEGQTSGTLQIPALVAVGTGAYNFVSVDEDEYTRILKVTVSTVSFGAYPDQIVPGTQAGQVPVAP